jgi:hypothetical protein
MRSCILARQPCNVGGCDSRPLLHPLRGILFHFLGKLVKTQSVAGDVAGIVQALMDDDVHHAQGQGRVRTRIDGQIPIRTGGGAGAIRIDDHQLRAPAAGLGDERPKVDVVAMDVRGPGDDVA